ncbi:F0F1 ATP synthase subunit B family protein [Elioraea rosea]|uniref:F0F1 ATP synthase subunit B family protein n=1 Tax=Elioraea rosea TaxID=2492390 RepID=UPI0011863D9C|nr:F0F1 ATP synthase subunit B [Elioraea rosea]
MLSDPKFWVGVSFVLFVIVAWKPLVMRLAKALDARGEKIRAEIEEARRLRAEAEAMLKRAEAARAEAEAEAAALLMHAKDEATRIGEQARADLDAALKRRERMALDRIAAAEVEASAAVRAAAADVAVAAARDLIAKGLTQDGHAALVDAAIADIPQKLH